MKPIKSLAVLLLLALTLPAYAQLKLQIGPSAGLTIPESDYSGTILDYYNGTKYGMSTGYNLGIVAKANLLVLNVRAAINYSHLSNSGSGPDPGSTIDVKQNLVMLSLGPEFYFSLPGSPVKPYIGADLLLSNFTGESSFQGVSRVATGTYSMSSAARTGLGLGAGVEFGLGKTWAFDFNLRYNMINLFGKGFDGLNTGSRTQTYESLNDAKDPVYPNDINDHPVSGNRTISTLQFNLGILFGL